MECGLMCEDKWSMIGFEATCPKCGRELHPTWEGEWECYSCDKSFMLEINYKFICFQDEEGD